MLDFSNIKALKVSKSQLNILEKIQEMEDAKRNVVNIGEPVPLFLGQTMGTCVIKNISDEEVNNYNAMAGSTSSSKYVLDTQGNEVLDDFNLPITRKMMHYTIISNGVESGLLKMAVHIPDCKKFSDGDKPKYILIQEKESKSEVQDTDADGNFLFNPDGSPKMVKKLSGRKFFRAYYCSEEEAERQLKIISNE